MSPEAREPLSKIVAARLRDARKQAGLTQKQWSARTGVPQTSLSDWEQGRGMAALDSMGDALAAVGIDAAVLIGRYLSDPVEGEADLVALYRSLSPPDREFILRMVELQTSRRTN